MEEKDDLYETSQLVNITEFAQLTKLGIPPEDINWTNVKLSSDKWICIRHHNLCGNTRRMSISPHKETKEFYFRKSSFDSGCVNCSSDNNHCSAKTILTLLSPHKIDILRFETNSNITSAQVNPQSEKIAVSNSKHIAIYNLETCCCLYALTLPFKCLFWTWADKDIVAFVSENDVYHWDLQYPLEPQIIFRLEDKMHKCQFTNYKFDLLYNSWCFLSGLYLDDEAEICGLVQINSNSYNQSCCIEAHATHFTTYKFSENLSLSNVLLAAKKTASNHVKIFIIELGPVQDGNLALISRTEQIHWDEPREGKNDIPVAVESSSEYGLIYIISKFGIFYVCDLENGFLLFKTIISQSTIFTSTLDTETQGILVISRCGQMLGIEMQLPQLTQYITNSLGKKPIVQRLQNLIDQQQLDQEQVTRL